MTEQQRKSLVATITADVLQKIDEAHPLYQQHRTIAVHEAGHAVVARALGLQVEGAIAEHTFGMTFVGTPLVVEAALTAHNYPDADKLRVCADLWRARLSSYLAGSIAVKIGVSKGFHAPDAWHREPSAADLDLAAEALANVQELTGEQPAEIIRGAVTRATEIITKHWSAIEGVAERLRIPNRSADNANIYLEIQVPISPLV